MVLAVLVPVLLLGALPGPAVGSAIYFPQSNLTVGLPRPAAVARLPVLRTLRNDSTEASRARYEISVAPEGIAASIDPETTELLVRGTASGDPTETRTIVVTARERGGGVAVSEVRVRFLAANETRFDCAARVRDMCFWSSASYRIYENQPATPLGRLGPGVYADLCPSFRLTGYSLLNGSEYFAAVNGTLVANANLDRDTEGPAPAGPGPRLDLRVRCIVWEEVTGSQYAEIGHLSVDVLDQDDNPPTAQGNASIDVTLRDFTAGDKLVDENSLILKDADAESSNRYTVRILGDSHDALNVTYDTLLIEAPKRIPSTAILARISARTTLLPKSPYRVILQVRDESLIPASGESALNITVTLHGPEHRTSTTSAPPTAFGRQPTFLYPSSVKVARLASRYTRVASPSVEPDPATSFAVQGSDAFAVTQRGGIVYVADEALLGTERASLTLKIKWSGRDRAVSSRSMRVGLITVPAAKAEACNRSESSGRRRSCANAETPEECEASCGVAAGSYSRGSFSGRCAWRWNKRSRQVSLMSEHYPTCSPDLTRCPDNRCDDLERLDPRICPQDCTVESDVHFGHVNRNGRGIKSGLGTCACNDLLQCTCNVDRFPARSARPGRDGKEGKEGREAKSRDARDRESEAAVRGARNPSPSPCGPLCMVGVIGASFFLLVAIVGSLVTSRYRLAAKEARREGKRRIEDEANGIAISPSDYVDRGDGLLIGIDAFAAANRHLLLPKTSPPDPKWEFPRSRLAIEQVLGEGEFGRVLRATAIDIAGTRGPTTVAVKTLKENACASELADLLSEYQLLKEVQHPNVIRLLGACTTPGAPVYLVIEFAEFGSLRNYLRRCRRLDSCVADSDGPSSLSTAEGEQGTACHALEPRDILSFAWQISKGMAYLADIKLVHRDLAARNVLLATGKVCKISDFGLTRDVYEDDAYLKRSKGRVPVKWMAPESLADHVYTSKTDVWSFGVLLWELVTLGASPYPGVDVHDLYNLLKAGYRMERPANCSHQLYKLMLSCWHHEPAARPSFRELAAHWEKMLEDSVEYLDLNPRTVDNQAYFASLRALDSPSSSCNDAADDAETAPPRTNPVNYLDTPSPSKMSKIEKADELRKLCREPIELAYANDPSSGFGLGRRYESPIGPRSGSVASNSDNDLVTPTDDRPLSYVDMKGPPESTETVELLAFDDAKAPRP